MYTNTRDGETETCIHIYKYSLVKIPSPTPDWKIIKVHLIPVVVLNSIFKSLVFFFVQFFLAVLSFRSWNYTQKRNMNICCTYRIISYILYSHHFNGSDELNMKQTRINQYIMNAGRKTEKN